MIFFIDRGYEYLWRIAAIVLNISWIINLAVMYVMTIWIAPNTVFGMRLDHPDVLYTLTLATPLATLFWLREVAIAGVTRGKRVLKPAILLNAIFLISLILAMIASMSKALFATVLIGMLVQVPSWFVVNILAFVRIRTIQKTPANADSSPAA